MVAQAAEQLGPVDILVNCAGSHETIGPVWETDPEQWWRDVETNLRGTFLCARSVLPGMVARRRGWIFNVASNSAIEPGPYVSSYAAGKAAVLRFTDSVAAETGRFGIRVFAIGPGQVHTAMTDYILNSPAGQKWLPEVRDYPASLWVSPERAGQLVIFLATEEGDALSGRYIHVSDDVAELARSSERIRRDDLYVLRLRK